MDHDVIIIGAGPAGLSFAKLLASTGLNILVVEKQTEKNQSHHLAMESINDI